MPLIQRSDSLSRLRSARSLNLVLVLLTLTCAAGLLLCGEKIKSSVWSVHSPVTYRVASTQTRGTAPSFSQAYESSRSSSSNINVDPSSQPIPKILHHVYLGDLENLWQAEHTLGPQPGARFPAYNSTIRRSCPKEHNDWQYMFWNSSQAELLIQTQYSWFFETFQSYQTLVQQSDALRPFLMHAFGGLYLDIDVECFTRTDQLLQDRDIVLQLEDKDPKSLNNGVMASVRGHPFWVTVMNLMLARGSIANKRSFLGFKDLSTILKSTGPWILREAFRDYTGEVGGLRDGWAGNWELKDSRIRVFPLGSWFGPCKWDDYKCHSHIRTLETLPPELVGHHINSGTWLKKLKRHNRDLLLAWLGALACCLGCVYALVMCNFCRRKRQLVADDYTANAEHMPLKASHEISDQLDDAYRLMQKV